MSLRKTALTHPFSSVIQMELRLFFICAEDKCFKEYRMSSNLVLFELAVGTRVSLRKWGLAMTVE